MIILKLMALFLLLIVLPILIGWGPSYFIHKNTKGSLIYGYIFMLALLELAGIPVVLFLNVHAYQVFCITLFIVFILFALIGVNLRRKDLSMTGIRNQALSPVRYFGSLSLEGRIYFALIIICVLFQLAMIFVYASMDADDFYFNAQALTSQAYGTMYRVDESTGRSALLDIRHAMALFPMWQAFVSTISGVHVTILAHKVLPMVIIPMSYYLLFMIGRVLFPKNETKALIFTLLMNVWRVFGFVSYFTTETFFLLRTWQGKSFAGNFILPFILMLFLVLYSDNDIASFKNNKLYAMLFLAVIASGSSSSLAVLLSIMMIAMLGLFFYIRTKNLRSFIYQMLCCIPGILYILVYAVAA